MAWMLHGWQGSCTSLGKLDKLIDHGYLRPTDIDSFTIEQLADLGEEMADNVIQRFSEANFSRINSKSGFLMGIIRRIQQDGPDKGCGDLEILPRPVRHKLRDLIDAGRLRRSEIDMRMCRALAELPSDLGIEAVDKFSVSNLDHIRSKTGFMMGIIKRLQFDASGYDRHHRHYDRHDRYERDRYY
eukprot:evm.model.scf_2080.2 EVM.evm.TU.scf_2080.2   scf_2080:2183-3772(-)